MKPAHERVLARVEVSDRGCWVFTGALTPAGYGKVSAPRPDGGWSTRGAHVVVYEALIGPVPDGKQLDHTCRVRACCNPWHLEPVTGRENTLRGNAPSAINAAKTHCDNGHELTAENTYRWRGARLCRPCRRDGDRARRQHKTEYARKWRAANREHANAYARERRSRGRAA